MNLSTLIKLTEADILAYLEARQVALALSPEPFTWTAGTERRTDPHSLYGLINEVNSIKTGVAKLTSQAILPTMRSQIDEGQQLLTERLKEKGVKALVVVPSGDQLIATVHLHSGETERMAFAHLFDRL